MMWGYGQGLGMGFYGNMLIWSLLNLLIVLVITGLGYLILRALFKSGGTGRINNHIQNYTPPQDAMSILKERYARGEISREEYLRIREDLKQNEH